jgi:hypothetical protein
MDDKQFKMLIDELTDIRNLLILGASKAGANSVEISKVLNTSDSYIRQILTGTKGKRKKEVLNISKEI